MSGAAAAAALARRGRKGHVSELAELVRIPSVSSDPARRADVRRAAGWLLERLRALGMRTRTLGPADGPIVYGERLGLRGAPTLLIYGHYDVVAPEPLAAWKTPPFEPAVREGFIHGRGSSDDKGPVVCQLAALAAWTRACGRPPVNVRCVFEGQEEVGSKALLRLLERPPRQLWADAVVVSDTRMLGPGRPTLIEGLRGTLAAEIVVGGPPRDVHSGAFGGAVRNPAHLVCELVASLHDARGRVAIPGFYARVRPERAPRGAGLPSDLQLLREAGVREGYGERGFSAYERTTLRPSLDVNGLVAGHTGRGAKSIVPAEARAKLSFRLVPQQRPDEVARLLRRHVAERTPRDARVRVEFGKPAPPYRGDARGWAAAAAARALAASFGRRPVALRSGGTIPVVEAFARALRAPVVLMGFASPDDGMHGPNERFSLDSMAHGTLACVHFLDELATAWPRARRLPPGERVAA